MSKVTTLPAVDGVLIITVRNGNPNGDPAEGGSPRKNSWSNLGMITGECIKRKIRDDLFRHHGHEPGYSLFVSRGAVHETKIREAYQSVGALDKKTDKPRDAAKGNAALAQQNVDIRLFGQVITKPGEGRLLGPISIDIGESIYPIVLESSQGTRCSTASEERSKGMDGRNQEFSFRQFVPFAAYAIRWHLDPFQAMEIGMTELDYARVLESMNRIFRNDHSSMRGEMTLRKHIIFEHAEPSRCAEPAELFERIIIEADNPEQAFDWSTYRVNLPDPTSLPTGVTMRVLKD